MKSLFYYSGLLLLLCSNLARSQEKIRYEDRTHSSAIFNARHYVDSLRNELEIPGLSVSVSINNKIVWSEGFGYANVADQYPVTRATKFRIGSISKSLTSIAMAKLIETGRLDLNEFVQTYLPNFPEKKHKFTVKQLASHQSGIPHYRLTDFLINKRFNSVTESLEVFKRRKLKYEPGTDFEYSTFGYVLLSAVIEKAAGVPYLEYMDKEIFTPLGIQHTAPDDLTKSITGKSIFYKSGKPKEIKGRDLSYKWAGGGYLSTADDLVHIIDGMGEILSDQMIDSYGHPLP